MKLIFVLAPKHGKTRMLSKNLSWWAPTKWVMLSKNLSWWAPDPIRLLRERLKKHQRSKQ